MKLTVVNVIIRGSNMLSEMQRQPVYVRLSVQTLQPQCLIQPNSDVSDFNFCMSKLVFVF